MRKIVALVLCICFLFMTSCARDESQEFIDAQEKEMNEAMNEIEEKEKENVDYEDVFILRNNTSKDIYSVEFHADGKESLGIDAVLPAGNEVKVKNSGEWEIRAEFMSDEGEYYTESFGKVDLNYNGAFSVVILTETENGYAIKTEQ